jgi:hypothetical protein
MSWENRGERRYYYRAKRVKGKVVKTYHGADSHCLSTAYEFLREARRAEVQQRHDEQANWEAHEGEIRLYLSRTLRLARVLIESEGFHRTGRKPWRKRRQQMGELTASTTTTTAELVSAEDQAVLLERVLEGAATITETRQLLSLFKNDEDFGVGPYSTDGLHSLIAHCAGSGEGSEQMKKLIHADSLNQIDELCGGPSAPAAIRLLAMRVVTTRLHLADTELIYQELLKKMPEGVSPSVLEAREKRVDVYGKRVARAQHLYLSAIKALTDAQRLPLPTVQIAAPGGSIVNVAEKQINLSGAASPSHSSSAE